MRQMFALTMPVIATATATTISLGATPTPVPVLPAAGGIINDARDIAGSRVMRITSATTVPGGAINSYSYWPSFNSNSTRLMIGAEGGSPLLYDFNPQTFTLGTKRNLFLSNPAGSGQLDWQDAIWSTTNPDVIYAHANTGSKLWAYNVKLNTYSLVKDFGTVLPGTAAAGGANNPYIWQMSRSSDNDTFAFAVRTLGNYAYTGYAAYKVSTNTMLTNTGLAGLDEVQVDKTGRYVVVKTGNQGANVIEVQIKDLQTGGVTNLEDDSPDYAPGHSDNGRGIVVGADNWRNGITVRNLATPHTQTLIMNNGNDWNQSNHISMISNDESKALVSWFGDAASSLPWANSLSLVALDGSGVTKLGYHYSVYNGDYYNSPRADMSMDGRFVTFTSNWGNGTGRRDVFVFALPLKADANKDAVVDGADFDAWFTHLGMQTTNSAFGDFNADGRVDGADFDLWFTTLQNNLNGQAFGSFGGVSFTEEQIAAMSGYLTPEQFASIGVSVPEAGSLAMLAVGAMGLVRRRRRG